MWAVLLVLSAVVAWVVHRLLGNSAWFCPRRGGKGGVSLGPSPLAAPAEECELPRIKFLGHAGFVYQWRGVSILFDPWSVRFRPRTHARMHACTHARTHTRTRTQTRTRTRALASCGAGFVAHSSAAGSLSPTTASWRSRTWSASSSTTSTSATSTPTTSPSVRAARRVPPDACCRRASRRNAHRDPRSRLLPARVVTIALVAPCAWPPPAPPGRTETLSRLSKDTKVIVAKFHSHGLASEMRKLGFTSVTTLPHKETVELAGGLKATAVLDVSFKEDSGVMIETPDGHRFLHLNRCAS